jgi:acetyl-CoA carboxylase biotin carboxyl carrier protein
MAFTFKDVAEILKMIDASQCEEVVLELEGLRLVVRRGSPHGGATGNSWASPGNLTARAPAGADPSTALPPREVTSFGQARAELSIADGYIAVRAPMVGTFYRRPSPQEQPFVEVGQRVKSGDALCLIEVMKLFTTIPSPGDGVVETIAVADASPVEFNQLLVVIKPVEGA